MDADVQAEAVCTFVVKKGAGRSLKKENPGGWRGWWAEVEEAAEKVADLRAICRGWVGDGGLE